ncbi:MAG: tRNA pseudouridine(38-40) synthase TruA [Rhodospirillales bacterium]|jgi:tRNA pseudouridine38-40 synthase|nr:tRNA pseudouridine(38-40) synthase TruA [Rhodospirillales bacterium]
MPRFKITLEYDGGGFVGWQRQANGFSVQQALEEAITEFSGETVTVFGAGRTDAGVHALGQVAHFDLARLMAPDKVQGALNFHLKPAPAAVLSAAAVDDGFDARFSAKERAYRYRISNRRAPLTLERGRAWRVPVPLDAEAMKEAAGHLIGKHDFTSFRATRCQAESPVRNLDTLTVRRRGDDIVIDARARSFLHHQVRNITGSLKWVGEGKWTPDDIKKALAARDRSAGGQTAPPHGLYLVEVVY